MDISKEELQLLAEQIASKVALKVWNRVRKLIREQQQEIHDYEEGM